MIEICFSVFLLCIFVTFEINLIWILIIFWSFLFFEKNWSHDLATEKCMIFWSLICHFFDHLIWGKEKIWSHDLNFWINLIFWSVCKKLNDLMFRGSWSYGFDLRKFLTFWFWSYKIFDPVILRSKNFMICWFWSQKFFDLQVLVLIHLVCKPWTYMQKKLLIFCFAKQRRNCDIVSFKATSAKKEGISMISTVPK